MSLVIMLGVLLTRSDLGGCGVCYGATMSHFTKITEVTTWMDAAVCRACGAIVPRRDACVLCGGLVLAAQVDAATVDALDAMS